MEQVQTIGRYRVVEPLGRGGMGVVYRAHDESLQRDVAIKRLTDERVADPERLQRLRREARLLAALTHPNIAVLYGLEEQDGVPFLVMELIDGESLADVLKRGPLPYRQTLQIARQIALALEAAHERGIVHRDLKPGNVMLTRSGDVKLLDFGLARRFVTTDEDLGSLTREFATTDGRILGTFAYMSPEQARGIPTDARCDVWAFGCVLFELLTGQVAFHGNTPSDLIVALLERDPDWSLLSPFPARIFDLLERCLRKDRDDRLHHMADARIVLDEALGEVSRLRSASAMTARVSMQLRRRPRWPLVAGAAVAAAALLAGGVWLGRGLRPAGEAAEPLRRFAIDLPAGMALPFGLDDPPSFALSPRADLVAFVAGKDGDERLHVRALDEDSDRELPGTEGARAPFFSPDGQWLGYFAHGKLAKIAVRGGGPTTLCDAPRGLGGAWSPDGWIVFAPQTTEGLQRTPAEGGKCLPLTTVDRAHGEQGHWAPSLLPDGGVVFTVYTGGRSATARVALQAAGATSHRTLLENGSHGTFLAPRFLVWARGRELFASAFDPQSGRLEGSPVPLVAELQDSPSEGFPFFALASSGALLWVPAITPTGGGGVAWLDRRGRMTTEIETSDSYFQPRLSADGKRIAFHFGDPDLDVWIRDLAGGSRSRLTKESGIDGFAVWSPDGRRVAFSSGREGVSNLFAQPIDGSGPAMRLLPPGRPRWPTSWSPDGNLLLYNEDDPTTHFDLWALDLRSGRPTPLVQSRFQEGFGRFSPDGRWIAYDSDETGKPEVYLRATAPGSPIVRMSTTGGSSPFWSASGELFYLRDKHVVATRPRLGAPPEPGREQVLFASERYWVTDVDAAGERFLAFAVPPDEKIHRLQLVLGWRGLVQRLVPDP